MSRVDSTLFFVGSDDVEFDISDYGAPARDRPGRQTKKINYNFDKSSSSGSGSEDNEDDFKDNDGVLSPGPAAAAADAKKNGASRDPAPKKRKSFHDR